jgi:two-component sensor histidine kinase
MRQTTIGSPLDALAPLQRRIDGLGRTHDLIVDVDWDGVPFALLAQSHLSPYIATTSQVAIRGPDISLTPTAAQHIGLALHELASNALKYGALSVRGGRVRFEWSIETLGDERLLQVKWTERSGPVVTMPPRRGFGCLILERVAPQSLDGHATLHFIGEGVAWEMNCPAENAMLS